MVVVSKFAITVWDRTAVHAEMGLDSIRMECRAQVRICDVLSDIRLSVTCTKQKKKIKKKKKKKKKTTKKKKNKKLLIILVKFYGITLFLTLSWLCSKTRLKIP